MRRLDSSDNDFSRLLAQLGARENATDRQLEQTVAAIIDDVVQRGD